MNSKPSRSATWILSGTLLVVLVLGGLIPAIAAPSQTQQVDFIKNDSLVIVRAGHGDQIPPAVRSPVDLARTPKTATIVINYQTSWPASAQTAFRYAADIWETLIDSSVTITVDAHWLDLGDPNILGAAGANGYYANFPGAPESNTYYSAALANTLRNSDPSVQPEIVAYFNSTFPSWYFGVDANPGGSQYDFVSVVLHELGHGLGFLGSMNYNAGTGSWGIGAGYPIIFDRFAENGSGQSLISAFPNPSTALGTQLTSGNIFFDGTYANAANGGSPPELYAPATWEQGSSFAHLDEAVFPGGNANALMTPYLYNGEANHNPGPITLGIFEDIGWNTAANTPPVIDGLPNQVLTVSTTKDNAIDLWAFTADVQDLDADLSFALVAPLPAAEAGVTIDSNRYIDISPAGGWMGSTSVTVQVTDTDANTDTDTFSILVWDPDEFVYLPSVQR